MRFLFVLALLLWTWLLLKPHPVPEIIAHTLLDDVKFVLGKLLHLCTYALLTWWGLKLFPGQRRWLIGGMMLHGILTELGQYYGHFYYDTQRTGRVYDVLIDWCGIALAAYRAQLLTKTP